MKAPDILPLISSLLAPIGVPVVINDLSAQATMAMESALTSGGAVLVVAPLQESVHADQARVRSAETVHAVVVVRTNPNIFTTPYQLQDSVIKAITANSTSGQILAGAPDGKVREWLHEDAGNLSHTLHFRIPGVVL